MASRDSLIGAFGLGLASGMRSMTPLAVTAARLPDPGRSPGIASRLPPRGRKLLLALAAGELVADKLPMTPSRTSPPALIARLVSGAAAAAATAEVGRRSSVKPALAGALGAWVASFYMERLRVRAGRRSGLPDPLIGLAEDVLALALARRFSIPPDAKHRSRDAANLAPVHSPTRPPSGHANPNRFVDPPRLSD